MRWIHEHDGGFPVPSVLSNRLCEELRNVNAQKGCPAWWTISRSTRDYPLRSARDIVEGKVTLLDRTQPPRVKDAEKQTLLAEKAILR
jgi:hypothetical protein